MNVGRKLLKQRAFQVNKIWGGRRLAKDKNIHLEDNELLGETWEVSIHSDGPSSFGEIKLSDLLTDEQIPYLIKFIDTTDDLSIQVHPHDEYAKEYENSKGKSECWFTLDADENSGIYLGFKDGVKKEEFLLALESGADVTKFLNFYPLKYGDFFFVPAGAIHAIGKGVTLIEVQQSSGITYRVFDFNRLENGKPRDLHVSKAKDVLNFDSSFNSISTFQVKNALTSKEVLTEHSDFKVRFVTLLKGESLNDISHNDKRLRSLSLLKGKIEISHSNESETLNFRESIVLNTFDSVKILALEDSHILLVE